MHTENFHTNFPTETMMASLFNFVSNITGDTPLSDQIHFQLFIWTPSHLKSLKHMSLILLQIQTRLFYVLFGNQVLNCMPAAWSSFPVKGQIALVFEFSWNTTSLSKRLCPENASNKNESLITVTMLLQYLDSLWNLRERKKRLWRAIDWFLRSLWHLSLTCVVSF